MASRGATQVSHDACTGGDPDTDPAKRFRIGGSSESHDRACLRAGDPPPLVLALDVRGESMSSRSRSSQVYAERIGGIGPDDDNGGGGWAVYGAYREGSDSYVDALRGYVDTPSGPPSMHAHPGNGQCAPCGRWF
jgi:hypothetical protein